jgi:hypothetical protein
MGFIAPSMIWPLEHAQEGFVQKCSCLQRMIGTFASQIFRSQAA